MGVAGIRSMQWFRMRDGNWLRWISLLAAAAGLLLVAEVSSASAADIEAAADDRCLIEIEGPIRIGDFDRFIDTAQAIFPESNGESSAPNLVCLNSPGGNIHEAVKFARHFYKEGVGTVIRENDGCYSACAVLFMMGTAQGPEVAFANRTLHLGGIIGFHRPYLPIAAGDQVDTGELAAAYDAAINNILDLISVANSKSPWTGEPMMKSDLMQAMLAHVGDDFFYIDTIDDIGRFEVEAEGIPEVQNLTEESAFYACNNALQWQHGKHEEDITYAKFIANFPTTYSPVTAFVTTSGVRAFDVRAMRDGYANHRCIVAKTDGQLRACGVDEYHSVRLGPDLCDQTDFEDKLVPIRPISAWNPTTRLATFAGAADDPAKGGGLRCYVIDQMRVVDDEPCDVERFQDADGLRTSVYIWPSGSRTVVVDGRNGPELNGAATVMNAREDGAACYPNPRTGRDFCVRYVDRQ